MSQETKAEISAEDIKAIHQQTLEINQQLQLLNDLQPPLNVKTYPYLLKLIDIHVRGDFYFALILLGI